MLGKTHRLGGVVTALGGFVALESTGNTLDDVNPLLQLSIIYPFAIYGSTASDQDHHWGSVPHKDPVSWLIYKALHLTTKTRRRMQKAGRDKGVLYTLLGIGDARHRSWQTHSDLTMITLIGLLWYTCFSQWSIFTGVEGAIVKLAMAGLILGLLAHIFLDAITPEGIWMVIPKSINLITKKKVVPEKFGLVPNNSWFATGGPWENLVYRVMTIASYALLAWIIYDALPWKFELNL